jgi:maltose O-acetyltransferase
VKARVQRLVKRCLRRMYWMLNDASDVPFAARGQGVQIMDGCRFQEPGRIRLGDFVYIGCDAYFAGHGGLTVGSNVAIGQHVSIYTSTHNYQSREYIPYDQVLLCEPVSIGDHCWIGARALILPGVEISEGAVIGAGSVVTKSIPRGAVAVGNPARVVKYRDMAVFEKLKAGGRHWMPYEMGLQSPAPATVRRSKAAP